MKKKISTRKNSLGYRTYTSGKEKQMLNAERRRIVNGITSNEKLVGKIANGGAKIRETARNYTVAYLATMKVRLTESEIREVAACVAINAVEIANGGKMR